MALPRRRVLALSKAIAAGSLLAGCAALNPPAAETASPSPRPSDPPTSSPPAGTPEGLSAPIEQFTFWNAVLGVDVFKRVATGTDNRLFSPYSVAVALAMPYAGARGETRSQMASTLRYPFDGEELHSAVHTLHERLTPADQPGLSATPSPTPTGDGERYELPLRFIDANALWGQAGFPWREAYLSLVDQYYAAGLRQLDFSTEPEAARERINRWVADVTRERITGLLPRGSISGMTRLVLTNAVYFRALWEHPFDPSETEAAPFTAIDGSTADVPMMRSDEESFQYAKIDGHQVVELPYRDGEFGMVVVLPPEGKFDRFQDALTASRLWRWLDGLESRVGTVTMPKFEFESGFELSDVLASLGMPAAFDGGRADFSGMTTGEAGEGLFIDGVHHKTFIGVDEKGTEAAAATGVVIAASAVVGEDPFELTLDRPFLFLIRERRTGAVVFLGRVVDASSATPSS